MSSDLEIRLFCTTDDEEDLEAKQFIQNVISGTSAPAEAAAQVGQWVMKRQEQAWLAVEGKNIDEIKGFPLAVCPNPLGDYRMLVGYIPPVCSAYPPGHAVQEGLLAFLAEMRNLPDWEMRQYTTRYNYDLEREVGNIEIITGVWKDYYGAREAFTREFDELDHPWSDVETPGSETLIRYTNYQSFLARLAIGNILNFAYCCSLLCIRPSYAHYTDLEKYKNRGARRLAGHLAAGAVWMATAETTKWMYEESRRGDVYEHVRDWNTKDWDEIKSQLVFIASKLAFAEEDKLLADKTKALAIELRDRMDQAEG